MNTATDAVGALLSTSTIPADLRTTAVAPNLAATYYRGEPGLWPEYFGLASTTQHSTSRSIMGTIRNESTDCFVPELSAVTRAANLLARTQTLFHAQSTAKALDTIYDELDALLLVRQFDDVRWIMQAFGASIAQLPLSATLAVLTITLPWTAWLGQPRADLAAAFRSHATQMRGVAETERLLRGLL